MISASLSANRVFRRIDLPCQAIGFEPPPCHLQARFSASPEGWTLIVRTSPQTAIPVADWLGQGCPARIFLAPGLAPRLIRAQYATLPPPWTPLLYHARLHVLALSPEAVASLFLEGTTDQMEHLMHILESRSEWVRCRPTSMQTQQTQLTRRQMDALGTAVSFGYYELPHRIDLRTLAMHMGISLGAISELLRRAEAAILSSFADGLATAPWEPPEPGEWHEIPNPKRKNPWSRAINEPPVLLAVPPLPAR